MKILASIICAMSLSYATNTITMAYSKNVGELNPQGYNQNQRFAQNMLYEGLLKINDDGHIAPSLATKWEMKDSGKTYIFTLRENVYFSNGEKFDAYGVKKNIDSVLVSKARHSWLPLVNILQSAIVLSPYKIALHLKHPYVATLNELALIRPFRFVAPSQIPDDLNLIKHAPHPIGTGPYKLIESKIGISDTFVKNEKHWDKSKKIYFDKVVIKVIYDPNSKLSALKSKQVDLIYGYDEIPFEIFKSMFEGRDKDIKTYLSKDIFTTSLVLNSQRLDDASRGYLRSLIDTKSIVDKIYRGIQKDAKYIFDIPTTNKLDDKHTSIKRELILIYLGDNPIQKMIGEILQANLKAHNITLHLKAAQSSNYRNLQLKGDFDICFNNTWGAPYEPLSELYSMTKENSHVDYVAQSGLSNKAMIDRKIKNLISITNETEQKRALQEVISLLDSANIYIPLIKQKNKAIAKKEILGIESMGVESSAIKFWEFYK